jgi:hypothetical protein
MTKKIERPDVCTDEHLDFLDKLRASGVTNMFGAAAYLMADFDVNKREATDIFVYWANTFPRDEADDGSE